jgi:hypothetical protein
MEVEQMILVRLGATQNAASYRADGAEEKPASTTNTLQGIVLRIEDRYVPITAIEERVKVRFCLV